MKRIASYFDPDMTLEVQGFSEGIGVGLVIDRKNQNDTLVKAVINFAKSSKWRDSAKANGFLTVKMVD